MFNIIIGVKDYTYYTYYTYYTVICKGNYKMYLYIFENGEIKKSTTFSDCDAEACDAGILDVIKINDVNPKQYGCGQWHFIDYIDR